MAEFAVDHIQRQELIEPGAAITISFGPPTAGTLTVLLYAVGVSIFRAQVPPDPRFPAATTIARPGIGPRAGVSPAMARVRLDTLNASDFGLGVFDPGGGFDPPPPPPPIAVTAFRVEVLDARATVRATEMGPMTFEVPEPPPHHGPVLGAVFGGPGRPWSLRVTNTSAHRAHLTVNLLFHGQRPVLTRDIDLQFLNEKLDLLFNVPQPIQIAFRNRTIAIGPFSFKRTYLVVEATEAWRELHPDLADLEKDLGAHVFHEETGSYEIKVDATVHDGSLAFRAHIAFPSFRGRIAVLDVLRALGHDTIATIGDIFTTDEGPMISIRNFAFDVFLVLRPQGVHLRPGPTFEVITRPNIELDPGWATLVVEALMQVAFERLLPDVARSAFHVQGANLLGWLLGDGGRQVTGSDQALALRYAGDPPRPLEVALDPGVDPASFPVEPGNLAKIDHIVVVMMENRSFDHMLGFLSLPTSGNDGRVGLGRTNVDGLRGNETNPLNFSNARHRVFSLATPWGSQRPLPTHETRGTKFRHDPGHSYEATLAQRGDYDIYLPSDGGVERAFHVGRNEGFIFDFARVLSRIGVAAEEQVLRGEIMGYHPAAHVPMYQFLAEQYAVCDRWFAAHPGHTWPNRFVSLTGRLNVDRHGFPEVNNPDLGTFDPLETRTIFDHLTEAGVEWRYFEQDFCMLRLFSRYTFDRERVVTMDHPTEGFFALARAGKLPPVTYIEPDLTDIPPGSDDHPPSDIAAGQALTRRIFNALAEGPAEQWQKTLFIVTYDEHGGFFDHVHPDEQRIFDPQSPAEGGFVPIGLDPETREAIDHYGFRVPTLVASAWIPPASVSSEVYDHTSILKTIIARFLSERPPNMGLRVALAKDVGSLLSLNRPRLTLRPPVVDFRADGHDAIALARMVPPDDDFRVFMAGMRTRVRGGFANPGMSRSPRSAFK